MHNIRNSLFPYFVLNCKSYITFYFYEIFISCFLFKFGTLDPTPSLYVKIDFALIIFHAVAYRVESLSFDSFYSLVFMYVHTCMCKLFGQIIAAVQ